MSTFPTAEAKRAALEAELLTYADVAKLLNISEKTVARLPIPGHVNLGRSVRFVAAEVRRWVAAGCPANHPQPQ